MIQRRLYTILQQGLAAFAANPDLYNIVFGQYLGLGDKEVASIRATLTRTPVRIQHGFAHRDITMPTICIVLQAESQSQKYLGDLGYLPLGGEVGVGSLWENSYQLMVYSENIDLTSYIYELVKAIFIMSHNLLAQWGIIQPSFTGMDLAPDPSYAPENVFVRVFGLRAFCQYVLPELLDETVLGTLIAGLALPPGTERAPEPYTSGVTVLGDNTDT